MNPGLKLRCSGVSSSSLRIPPADSRWPLMISSETVSYTHLDVYKRQVHNLMGGRMFPLTLDGLERGMRLLSK